MMNARIAPLSHALPARWFAPRLSSLDGFFDATWRGRGTGFTRGDTPVFTPRVDIHEDEAAYRICAELPGLDETDIQVTFEENTLTIAGERKQETEREDAKGVRHRESFRGRFRRSFRLPEGVDAEALKAGYSNGVLEVTVPKPAAPEPDVRTIPVEAG